MKITTLNHTYEVIDIGDGGIIVSGHPRYCPIPTRAILTEPIEIGNAFIFKLIEGPRADGHRVITTCIVSVTE